MAKRVVQRTNEEKTDFTIFSVKHEYYQPEEHLDSMN